MSTFLRLTGSSAFTSSTFSSENDLLAAGGGCSVFTSDGTVGRVPGERRQVGAGVARSQLGNLVFFMQRELVVLLLEQLDQQTDPVLPVGQPHVDPLGEPPQHRVVQILAENLVSCYVRQCGAAE